MVRYLLSVLSDWSRLKFPTKSFTQIVEYVQPILDWLYESRQGDCFEDFVIYVAASCHCRRYFLMDDFMKAWEQTWQMRRHTTYGTYESCVRFLFGRRNVKSSTRILWKKGLSASALETETMAPWYKLVVPLQTKTGDQSWHYSIHSCDVPRRPCALFGLEIWPRRVHHWP